MNVKSIVNENFKYLRSFNKHNQNIAQLSNRKQFSGFFFGFFLGSLFVQTKHIAIFEGDSVQLCCEDLENSNVCKWFKDGEEILPSNKTSVKNDGHSYQLNIHDAEKCDKGQYTCGDNKKEMIFYLYVKGI